MAHRLVLDPLPIETPRVVFDVTRLHRNRLSAFGTGVDRIDLAIGLDLARRFGEKCRFVHVVHGGFAELPRAAALALLEALDARWHGGEDRRAGRAALPLLIGRAKAAVGASGLDREDATYVVASHSGLPQRPGYLARLDPRGVMRRAAYVHDLIPIEYPEHQTARSTRVFSGWLEQLAERPVDWFTNSEDTARRLAAHAARRGWGRIAPRAILPRLAGLPPTLRAARAALAPFLSGDRPFFLIVGTIEPRKNHLLLLHLWRRMAERRGEAPALVIAGRRGWMTDAVAAMLDRCVAIRPFIHEFGDLTDAEIAALMRAATALLFPSFAEGLGLPALEAKAAGLPMIASDLPALREIAGEDAVFLDPLDGPAWEREILSRRTSPG